MSAISRSGRGPHGRASRRAGRQRAGLGRSALPEGGARRPTGGGYPTTVPRATCGGVPRLGSPVRGALHGPVQETPRLDRLTAAEQATVSSRCPRVHRRSTRATSGSTSPVTA